METNTQTPTPSEKPASKTTRKWLYLGIIAGAALVLGVTFATNLGQQVQGYLNFNKPIDLSKLNINRDISKIKFPEVTCKGEAKPLPNNKTQVNWLAEVKNATPVDQSDPTNPYKLVWFTSDCGNSGATGWVGTGVQLACPSTQTEASIQVVAAFKESDSKNNIASCTVKIK